MAFGVYLLLAIFVWWQVWSTHPAGVSICGCGDPSLFFWSIAWPAHAIAHGLNPLYSSALLHPLGYNLLTNTAVPGVGILLSPVTWIWGPIATINVASTLAPVTSAMAMYWALGRWTSWRPAAFFGGLFYGFSPFVIFALGNDFLTLSILAVPPLMLVCLDELLIRQRRPAWVSGLALAVLATFQFFISTEVLTITVVLMAVGVMVLVAWSAVAAPQELSRRLPHAARGALVAAVGAAAALAYPLWFALAGPANLPGQIPTNFYKVVGSNAVQMFWRGTSAPLPGRGRFSSYQGFHALPSPAYVGIAILVISLIGWVLWCRDRKLWLFGVLGLAAAWFSLGLPSVSWTPWSTLSRLPFLDNVLPGRFSAAVDFCLAATLAFTLDHLVDAVADRRVPDLWALAKVLATKITTRSPQSFDPRWPVHRSPRHGIRRPIRRLAAGTVVGTALGAVALVPMVQVESPVLPLTAVHVDTPRWFAVSAPKLPPHQVLFIYPYPSSGIQSAMVWQAMAGFPFDIVGGGGPGAFLTRAGRERNGSLVLRSLTANQSNFQGLPAPTPANLRAVRYAFDHWGVTMVVVPDQTHLRSTERGSDPAYAVHFLSAVLGVSPHRQPGAWVWSSVRHAATLGSASQNER